MGCSEPGAGLVGSKHASRMAGELAAIGIRKGRESGEVKIGSSQGQERWVGFDNENTS